MLKYSGLSGRLLTELHQYEKLFYSEKVVNENSEITKIRTCCLTLFLFIDYDIRIANTHPPTCPIVVHIDRVHELRGPPVPERRCTLKKPLRHSRGRSHVVPAATPLERVPRGQGVERDGHGGKGRGRDKRGRRGWFSSWWSRAGTGRQAP